MFTVTDTAVPATNATAPHKKFVKEFITCVDVIAVTSTPDCNLMFFSCTFCLINVFKVKPLL